MNPQRRVSPFQRQKAIELFAALHPDADAEQGIDALFVEQVGHGIDRATYDEAKQVLAELVRQRQAQYREQTAA